MRIRQLLMTDDRQCLQLPEEDPGMWGTGVDDAAEYTLSVADLICARARGFRCSPGILDLLSKDDDDTEPCAYCGADVPSDEQTPPSADDDDAWADLARGHAPWCDWIRTRAHRLDEDDCPLGEED